MPRMFWVTEAGHPGCTGADSATIMSGELTAMGRALSKAIERRTRVPTREVQIRYDSQEAFAQAIGRHRGKLHLGLQGRIQQHLHTLREGGVKVLGFHIPSHKGEVGNEAADWLANRALERELDMEHQQVGQTPVAISMKVGCPLPRLLVFISLFDGIGGAHCAVSKLGWPLQAFYSSEIDPVAIGILRHRYPSMVELGDSRGVDDCRLE